MMKDVYGYDAFQRGWILSITWSVSVITIPIAGRYGERLFRKNPPSALKLMGVSILLYGLFLTIGLRFESAALLIAFFAIGNAFQGMAFTQMGPTISAVVPYQMRAQAFAMVGVYIFLMGGFFGVLAHRRILRRLRSAHGTHRCGAARSASRWLAHHLRIPLHEARYFAHRG